MWKNAGVLLLIGGLIFGWLRTHDHYVRADALAVARRDSLLYADKVLARQNGKISLLQDSLHLKADKIGAETIKVREQAKGLETKGKMDEFEYAKWKDSVAKVTHDSVVIEFVRKSDAYIVTLKAQVVVATRLEMLARDSTKVITELYFLEKKKYDGLKVLNEGLKKELGAVGHTSLGKVITNYVIPSAAITFIITKVTDGNTGKSGNQASTDRSSIRGTEEGIPLR